jgi:hypothetical protein
MKKARPVWTGRGTQRSAELSFSYPRARSSPRPVEP